MVFKALGWSSEANVTRYTYQYYLLHWFLYCICLEVVYIPVKHKQSKTKHNTDSYAALSTDFTATVNLKVSFPPAKMPYEKFQAEGSRAKWLDSARLSPVWDYTQPHETSANGTAQEIQS